MNSDLSFHIQVPVALNYSKIEATQMCEERGLSSTTNTIDDLPSLGVLHCKSYIQGFDCSCLIN